MQHRRPRTQILFLLATCLVWQTLALCAEAQSHRGVKAGAGHHVARGGHHAKAVSTRPLPRPGCLMALPIKLRNTSCSGGLTVSRVGLSADTSITKEAGGPRITINSCTMAFVSTVSIVSVTRPTSE